MDLQSITDVLNDYNYCVFCHSTLILLLSMGSAQQATPAKLNMVLFLNTKGLSFV